MSRFKARGRLMFTPIGLKRPETPSVWCARKSYLFPAAMRQPA